MRGAVGTVVAVDGVAWRSVSLEVCGWGKESEGRTGVAFVAVDVCFALCDLEVRFRGYLVESVFATGEDFAGVAVAGNVDGQLFGEKVAGEGFLTRECGLHRRA